MLVSAQPVRRPTSILSCDVLQPEIFVTVIVRKKVTSEMNDVFSLIRCYKKREQTKMLFIDDQIFYFPGICKVSKNFMEVIDCFGSLAFGNKSKEFTVLIGHFAS